MALSAKEEKELLEENESLKAQLAEAVVAKESAEAELVKASKTGNVALPVKGKFTAKWKTPMGDDETRIVEFKKGATKLRFPDNSGRLVSTESVLKLSNGKKLSKKELEASPALSEWEKEDAAKFLTKLAKIGYGQLK